MYIYTYMHSYIHTFIHTDISGHRVGRSVFSCSGTDSGDPVTYIVPGFHRIISLRTACGDSVFCCSGTASGDPCHYISSQHFCAHRLWRLSFLFLVKMRCEAARRSTRDLVLQHTPLQACARRPQCVSSSVGTRR